MTAVPLARGLVLVGSLVACAAGADRPAVPSLPPAETAAGAVLTRAGYVAVPLRRGSHNNWLYVDAAVDGRPARFMLDTGAAPNTLLVTSGERLGYVPTHKGGGIRVIVGGPAFEDFNTIRPLVGLPGLSPRRLRMTLSSATGLDDAFKLDGENRCDGLLGAPLLHAYSAVIDYSAGKLYLLDPWVKEMGLLGSWALIRSRGGTSAFDRDALADFRLDAEPGAMTLRVDRKREFSVVLDPSTPVRRMEWIDEAGVVRRLIYKLDGDKLTIAGGLWKVSPAFPNAFEPAADGSCVVLEFERKVYAPAPPPRSVPDRPVPPMVPPTPPSIPRAD